VDAKPVTFEQPLSDVYNQPSLITAKPNTNHTGNALLKDVKSPTTLPQVLETAPENLTAVIVPEAGISISYGKLRREIATLADKLA
jgi:hypothetical protein